jgi:hypothetical protein
VEVLRTVGYEIPFPQVLKDFYGVRWSSSFNPVVRNSPVTGKHRLKWPVNANKHEKPGLPECTSKRKFVE